MRRPGRRGSRSVPARRSRIMTGAPIPAGADAVVMVERTRLEGGPGGDRGPAAAAGAEHHAARARDAPRRDGAGGRLGAAAAGIRPPGHRGDASAPGCIRPRGWPSCRPATRWSKPANSLDRGRSATAMGRCSAARWRGPVDVPHYLGIARDRLDSLRPGVAEGLQADVLLLSGGVSAGQARPGAGRAAGGGRAAALPQGGDEAGQAGLLRHRAATKLVFGLPGNPVSALVCFELFVRPALRRAGRPRRPGAAPVVRAALAEDFAYRSDRPTYHPAVLDAGLKSGWRCGRCRGTVRPTCAA